MPRQILTIELDGLTAGDYLAHVADPEPSALGRELRSVTVRGEPLGTTVEAILVWAGRPPHACAAATAAGLPFVAEAVSIEAREIDEIPAPAAPAPKRRGIAERIAAKLDGFADRAAAELRGVRAAPAMAAQVDLRRW
ncbi:MAG TPA: hypothetical protein VF587_10940 [Solirubrobacteraceae bacterium]